MGVEDLKSYRPISNLTYMSKLIIIESMVYRQIAAYLEANHLFPEYQPGFRIRHSTETTVLKVLSDISTTADQGSIGLLMFPGYVGCVRHGRPQNSSPAFGDIICNLWYSARKVTFIPI